MATGHRIRSLLLLGYAARIVDGDACPGSFDMPGYGQVSIVPTGWPNGAIPLEVQGNDITVHMDGRAYFADACTAGSYDHNQYLALPLLGRKLVYTIDLSGAGCGCNAAMYLTSMKQNTQVSTCNDYYCDANVVCGVACTEIDIQEANIESFHATLHASDDKFGVARGAGGGGAGWNGPRDWSLSDYGPGGRCVDTKQPYEVGASFHTNNGQLSGMQIELSQAGKPCTLSTVINDYNRMADLAKPLQEGMTPIISYWENRDMLWLDGTGPDHQGGCNTDTEACSDTIRFSNFRVEDISNEAQPPAPPVVIPPQPREITIRLDPVDLLPAGFDPGAEITVMFQGQPLHGALVSVSGLPSAGPSNAGLQIVGVMVAVVGFLGALLIGYKQKTGDLLGADTDVRAKMQSICATLYSTVEWLMKRVWEFMQSVWKMIMDLRARCTGQQPQPSQTSWHTMIPGMGALASRLSVGPGQEAASRPASPTRFGQYQPGSAPTSQDRAERGQPTSASPWSNPFTTASPPAQPARPPARSGSPSGLRLLGGWGR